MRLSSSQSNVDEAELIGRVLQGDEVAAAELDMRYRPRLRRFVRKKIQNDADAEDIAQIAMSKAFAHLARFEPGSNFTAWLFTITRNVSADWVRQHAREPKIFPFDSADAASNDSTAAAIAEPSSNASSEHGESPAETDLFELAQRVLTSLQYQLIWMFYVERLTIAQMSNVTDRSQVAIRVQLFRAKRRLRSILNERTATNDNRGVR